LKMPKVGWVRFIDKFNVPENAEFRFVTVSVEGGKYFASICYKTEDVSIKLLPVELSKTVGIDLGLTTLVTLSDGTKVDNPRHLKKHENKILEEQQKLSKKRKGLMRMKSKKEF
jgi:putative transposase